MNRQRLLIIAAVVIAALLLIQPVVKIVSNAQEQKKLDGLLPEVRAALGELRTRLRAKGIDTWVGSTLRDDATQAGYVDAGVSATQKSWHLVGRAVDLYPYDPLTGRPDLAGHNTEAFRTMHAEASRVGFRGLAFNTDGSKRYINTSKGKVWDGGHLEYPAGLSYAEAVDDYRTRKVIA